MHPYYNRAMGLVGQPICIHAYGQVHTGILHQVSNDGVYIRRSNGMTTMSSLDASPTDIHLAPLTATDELAAQNVFWLWPLLFLPWLAIAALGPWWW